MAVEHAPEDKKGFYGSWPQLGAPLGLVLGTLVFSIFSATMTDARRSSPGAGGCRSCSASFW